MLHHSLRIHPLDAKPEPASHLLVKRAKNFLSNQNMIKLAFVKLELISIQSF